MSHVPCFREQPVLVFSWDEILSMAFSGKTFTVKMVQKTSPVSGTFSCFLPDSLWVGIISPGHSFPSLCLTYCPSSLPLPPLSLHLSSLLPFPSVSPFFSLIPSLPFSPLLSPSLSPSMFLSVCFLSAVCLLSVSLHICLHIPLLSICLSVILSVVCLLSVCLFSSIILLYVIQF